MECEILLLSLASVFPTSLDIALRCCPCTARIFLGWPHSLLSFTFLAPQICQGHSNDIYVSTLRTQFYIDIVYFCSRVYTDLFFISQDQR